jgi:type IV secretory pathway VirB2 component (pilin)
MNKLARTFKKISPLTVLMVVVATAPAFAATGGTKLPWEDPLTTIQDSLTGPVATAIATIAMFAAGAGLVFGDEMSNFMKRVLIGVMSLALLIAGNGFVTSLHITGHAI